MSEVEPGQSTCGGRVVGGTCRAERESDDRSSCSRPPVHSAAQANTLDRPVLVAAANAPGGLPLIRCERIASNPCSDHKAHAFVSQIDA